MRDDDWHGGNIKNAQNSPSNGFLLKVDQLVQATKNVPIVVFHCALSQVRCVPPLLIVRQNNTHPATSIAEVLKQHEYVFVTSAIPENAPPNHHPILQIYAETRDLLQAEGEDIPHEVLVLQGGFSDFQAKFHKDPALVENWDAEVWASEWAI